MNGRAALFMGPRKPFEITEFPVPDPEPDAIVMKVTQAGICGSDLHRWRSEGVPGAQAPETPVGGRTTGHEGTGVIYKLGSNVKTDALGRSLREGDRIVYSAIAPCGHCNPCLKGNGNWCTQGFFPRSNTGEFPYFTGTYADFYYIRPTQLVFQVPDELDDAVLGSVNCAMGTVTEGLMRADCKQGDYVVIQGAGGLGLNAVAAAKDMGAHRVIVIDRLQSRLDLAIEFGADSVINIEKDSPTPELRREHVMELTDGKGADICVELVGRSDLFIEGLSFLGNGGTFVEIGNILGGTVPFDPSSILAGKRIIGSAMYRPRLLPVMLETLVKQQGKVPYEKIASHSFPLEEINTAFEQAEWLDRQTSVTRCMLIP
jgi:D-arabinose 1-dehydrogenase-like Zn-dependent alcohol dehydrogenase